MSDRPLERLRAEHRLIEAVLDCLEATVESAIDTARVDFDSFRKCIHFFRSFADDRHHRKEELDLFPLLERKGLAEAGGPISECIADHDSGRSFLRSMVRELDRCRSHQPAAVDQLVMQSRGYVDMLRDHLRQEDEVLFTVVEEKLDETAEEALSRAFDDEDRLAAETLAPENLVALAEGLCSQWQVEFPRA